MSPIKLFAFSLVLSMAPLASAQDNTAQGLTTDISLLAAATPDECFEGIGQNTLGVTPPCQSDARAKVNEGYVWGMALAGDKVFFGTVANTQCLVIGTFLSSTTPFISEEGGYVCEFGQSPVLMAFSNLPPALGDFRPPNIYMYDRSLEALSKLSTAMPGPDQQRLASTLGIRAAGAHNGVVFFAGIALGGGGVNVFAFTDEGAFLESTVLPDYFNIRKFRVMNGELYAGLGFLDQSETPSAQIGHVKRWTGTVSDPMQFEVVGVVDSEVAELTEHEDRIFITTWPDSGANGVEAALYMSPEFDNDGRLSTSDATGWDKVFTVSDYEASPISAAVYGLGALASFDGYLFWGTMHVPGTGLLAHSQALDPGLSLNSQEALLAERSISIFRGRDFTDPNGPEIDLLYGYQSMPVMNPADGLWDFEPNKLGGMAPRFGGPGFNNPLNNYTWTMEVYDDRLWVGTMNVAGLFTQGAEFSTPGLNSIEQVLADLALSTLVGADLWFFLSADLPALPETLNGAGNPANYGFRTMETDGDELFIGTANPTNLRTDQTSRAAGIGGWELLSLEARPLNTLAGDEVVVEVGNGVAVNFCSIIEDGFTAVLDSSYTPVSEPVFVAINESLQGSPFSSIIVENAYLVVTSAEVSTDGVCDETPVTLSIDFDGPLYQPRLLNISLNLSTGEPRVEDVTLSTTPLISAGQATGFSTGIVGDASPSLGGITVLVSTLAPELSTQSALDVGEVVVGQASAPELLTVTNTGGGLLILGALSITGADAESFELVSDGCSGRTLAAGESCTVAVSSRGTSSGARTATINIPSNALGGPLLVQVSNSAAPVPVFVLTHWWLAVLMGLLGWVGVRRARRTLAVA